MAAPYMLKPPLLRSVAIMMGAYFCGRWIYSLFYGCVFWGACMPMLTCPSLTLMILITISSPIRRPLFGLRDIAYMSSPGESHLFNLGKGNIKAL